MKHLKHLSLGLTLLVLSGAAHAAPFTPGNLAVLQVGDGVQALANTGNTIYLYEFTTAGVFVQSNAVPDSGASALLNSGIGVSEGMLTRSTDGRYLCFAGYNTNRPSTVALGTTTSAQVPRVIGTMDFNGNYALAAVTTSQFSLNAIRSAVTDGTNNFWGAGSTSGTYYFGTASAAATLQSSIVNTRMLNIFNGGLYFSTASGTARGVYNFNPSGLPVTATPTNFILNAGATSSVYGFSINPNGTIAYTADDNAPTSTGGLIRWTNNGAGIFIQHYVVATNAVRGLVVDYSGANPVLYATTAANTLIKVTDTGASSPVTVLVTGIANTGMRGVAFTPFRIPVTNLVTSAADDGGAGTLRSVIASSVSGDTIQFAAGLNGATILLTGGQLSLNKNLAIDGSGLTNGISISGGGATTVFSTTAGTTNVLTALTITNGYFNLIQTGAGGIVNSGTLSVNQCTLAGNFVGGGGGGIWNNSSGTLTVNQCTLSGNTVSFGGGGGGIFNNGAVTVNQSTLSANSGSAGGIYNASGTLTLSNSIVAGNTNISGGDIGIIGGSFTSSGVNLTNGTPLLATLGNYGGPTQTMPPLPGSPAIDGCTNGYDPSFTTDQRGLPRLVDGNGDTVAVADIGAVEFTPRIVTSVADDGGAGTLRAVIANALNGDLILFTNTLSGATILLTNSQITLNKNLTIDGSTLVNGINLNGNNTSRIFLVNAGTTNVLTALTFTNGLAADYGGGVYNLGMLTVSNCTFVGNSAVTAGGAMRNTGTLFVNQCTIAKNSSANGGGIASAGTATINQSTVSQNSSTGPGGGAYRGGGTLTLNNSIVAGNTAASSTNIFGAFTATGANLTNGSPLLAPLGNYGGPTMTMPPLPGSPAIDGCTNGNPNFAFDQRGLPRVVGAFADIGAVEVAATNALAVVTTNSDSGPGSLRDAIAHYPTGSTITFSNTLSGATILLTSGELLLNKNLIIDGSALTNGITLDGNGTHRVLYVASGTTNVLTALTITNGYDVNAGGGIFSLGDVTLNQCTLSGNQVYNSPAGGGAIYQTGRMTLNQCTISGNQANSSFIAGGIYNDGGTLIVNQSTISSNSSSFAVGGIYSSGGTLTITNSIVAGNTPDNLSVLAGGIFTTAGVNFTNGNPLLAPLGNYGGPTQTMPPLPGSPAIDGCTNVTTFTTDQRGFARIVGEFADIGAVELTFFEGVFGPGINPIRWAVGSSNWNTTDINWTDVALNVPTNYTFGRSVIFDDLASGASPILVTNTLAITNGGILFSNTATAYTLFGPGVISNNVSITKLGTNTLTLASANTSYGGTFTLGEGKLIMNSGSSLSGASTGSQLVMRNNTSLQIGNGTTSTPGVPIVIAAGANVTLSSGNGLSSGPNGSVTSGDANAVLNVSGGFSFGGNLQGFLGTVRVNSAFTTRLSKGGAGATDLGSSNAIFIVNGSAPGLRPRNHNTTVHLGALSGTGTLGGSQTTTAANTTTYQIGALNLSTTFGGQFVDNISPSTNVAVVKVGSGTLTLTNHSPHTGSTTVSNGMLTLVTSGSLSNSAVTVAGGATNGVTLATAGGSTTMSNLTYAAAGTESAVFDFGANAPSTTTAPLLVQNTLAITGTLNLSIIAGGTIAPGTYPLIQYGAFAGTAPTVAFSLPPATVGRLVNDAVTTKTLYLVVGNLTNLVTSAADDGSPGTLRSVIASSLSGDTINFNNSLSGATILLTNASGELLLNKNLNIDASALTNGISINGTGYHGVFNVASGTTNVLTALTITNGASANGGGIYNGGTLTANQCTFSGNTVLQKGGGIYNSGTLTVNQCTLSGNNSIFGTGGGIANYGTLTVNQCTLSGNYAISSGGGIENPGTLNLTNSIVCSNTASSGPNISGSINSGANNLLDANALLAPLGNYGGPTQTMPPLPGSPAIDGCTNGAPAFDTDQRGLPRVVDGNGDTVAVADIGAVESGNAVPGYSPIVTVNSDTVNGFDVGGVSLREAVLFATNGTVITFDSGLNAATITLTSGELVLNQNLTIDGSSLPNGISINGNNASRIFTVNAGTTSVLVGLTLSGGNGLGTSNPADDGYGGAIENSGTLSLTNCILSGNSATIGGGAVINADPGMLTLAQCTLAGNRACQGGGLNQQSSGAASLINCILSGNSATNFAANNVSVSGGGILAFASSSLLSLDGCTVTNNVTGNTVTNSGGGLRIVFPAIASLANTVVAGNLAGFGGGIQNQGTLAMERCTVSGNAATFSNGGGVNNTRTLVLNQCTIAGNTAISVGGGIRNFNPGTVALTNCTVSANVANNSGGGGIRNDGSTVTIFNSIVAANDANAGEIVGTFTDAGSNLTNGNPVLAPLGNYGGPTQTMPPLPGSPAIDGCTNGIDPSFTTDQRGLPRVVDGNGDTVAVADIGAVESTTAETTPIVTTTADSGAGSLRQVISNALPGSTITFANTLSGATILLTNAGGELLLNKSLTIDASSLTNGITLNGNGTHRVFNVASGTTNVLVALTITNGRDLTGAGGGGIFVNSGSTLTVSNSLVSGNSTLGTNGVDGSFGGNGNGGGIYNAGTLMLYQNTFSANTATGGAGGFGGSVSSGPGGPGGPGGPANGGGIYNAGTLMLYQNTLSANTATGGFGGFGGFNISTFASGPGGYGGPANGGGIYNAGTLMLYQNTLSANTATGGSAGYGSPPGSSGGGYGGGVYNAATLMATNSIIAGNTLINFGGAGADIYGNAVFGGVNLVQTAPTGGTFTGTYITAAPLLAPLGNYGGPTPTMPPLPGSPAIDGCTSGTAFTTDQRGVGFPRVVGAYADIGAVEGILPPAVMTLAASGVSNTIATLNGTVNPNRVPTTAWFEWGTTNFNYSQQTALVPVGNGSTALAVSNNLTGLTPGIIYHGRVTASNVAGIVHGNEILFGSPAITLTNGAVVTNECHFAFTDPGATVTGAPMAIAAGQYHSLALKGDGTVAAWGLNINGQTNVPVDLSNVVAIAGAGYFSLALKSDGTVAAWGYNGEGETSIPVGLSNVVAIAGGFTHSLALKSDGTVAAWGAGTTVGGFPNYGQSIIPVGLSNVVAIAGGSLHSLALKSDGTVAAWGDNTYGKTTIPVGLSNVVAIAGGGDHNLALKSDGTVVAWGRSSEGQTTIPVGLSSIPFTVSGSVNTNSPGNYTLTYTFTNLLGGIAAPVTRTVVVSDTLPPVITVLGNYPLTIPVNVSFVDPGATNLDACGGSVAMTTNSTVNTAVIGTYSVSYTATDSSGNAATSNRVVFVVGPPAISALTATVLATNGVNGNRTVSLAALVNPDGLATTVNFLFGLTTAYGGTNSAPGLPASFAGSSVSSSVDLSAGFTYHWRVVAANGGGSTSSADQTLNLGTLGGGSGIPGDLNGDGIVSQSELDAVYASYVTNSPWLYMTNVAGLGGTNVTFSLSNSVLGAYTVEYTTNLTDWQPLGPATPRYLFEDTNAPAIPLRFYRLRYP